MHRVTHYRRIGDGIEAISLDTDRAFPRHAHDEFGVGVIVSGAHRSWSGRGTVDARAGDAIMVNPGEVHDGMPLGARATRSWRMLYLAPALVAGFAEEEGLGRIELVSPVVRERLDASPADAVSLAELANLAGVSRFQLLRGFARELGITPHAYLIQSRTRLARTLLARGLSIADAAAEAGFADQSHLTRAFTRQFGITPGRFSPR